MKYLLADNDAETWFHFIVYILGIDVVVGQTNPLKVAALKDLFNRFSIVWI